MILMLVVALTACGGKQTESKEEPAKAEQTSQTQQTTQTEQTAEEAWPEVGRQVTVGCNQGAYTFVNGGYINNAMFPNKKIAWAEMYYTNTTQQPQNIWTAFVVDFTVFQSDGTTRTELNGANGMFPADFNPELVDIAMGPSLKQVEPKATVHCIVGYDMQDPSAPVYFTTRLGQSDPIDFVKAGQVMGKYVTEFQAKYPNDRIEDVISNVLFQQQTK